MFIILAPQLAIPWNPSRMLDSMTAMGGPTRLPDADAIITQISPPTKATPARRRKISDNTASPM